MNNRVPVYKHALIGAAGAFALVFGIVWLASSLGGGIRSDSEVGKPTVVPRTDDQAEYTAPRLESGEAVAKVTPSDTSITGIPTDYRRPKTASAPTVSVKPRPVTPKDMFPMGNIISGLPKVAHPYRQIAELFPSFVYGGRVWMSTGRFVTAMQADLVPTGYRLVDGRGIYALANTSAAGSVLFVQSGQDPYKFAIYRRA